MRATRDYKKGKVGVQKKLLGSRTEILTRRGSGESGRDEGEYS